MLLVLSTMRQNETSTARGEAVRFREVAELVDVAVSCRWISHSALAPALWVRVPPSRSFQFSIGGEQT